MKIAYLLRGQARQTQQSSELFHKYTVDRFDTVDFDVHIYTWNHSNPSSQGLPTDRTYTDSMVLKDQLREQWHPTTICIGDNSHETQYNASEITILNQIIADLRGQTQLYNYYKLEEIQPDVIVDTRPEMFHWIKDGYWKDTVNVLNHNPNTVLVNKLKTTDTNLRYTSDYTFVYNWNTLMDMCSSLADTRLHRGLDTFPYNSVKDSNGDYTSHTLYPWIVYRDQTLLDTGTVEPPQTVLNTHYREHEVFYQEPTQMRYYAYSSTQ